MAKSQRVILFSVAPTRRRRRPRPTRSRRPRGRLGLPWSVRSAGAAGSLRAPRSGRVGARRLDELSFDIKDWEGRVERFPGGDLDEAVNRLDRAAARRRDDAPDPPHATSPAPPKKVHTVKVSRETAGRRGRA